MKVVAVNGSPRPAFNTAKLLKEAVRGAAEAGAETLYYDLYKMNIKGCISCFACKRIGHESGTCCVTDELAPLLKEVASCDGLIVGSPVYFGDVTSGTQAFLERLVFPALSYDDFSSRVFTGKVNAALVLTMNASDASIYQRLAEQKAGMLSMLHGTVETYASAFTVQFSDYAKYHAAGLAGPERVAQQPERFSRDLQAAYQLGYKLGLPEGVAS